MSNMQKKRKNQAFGTLRMLNQERITNNHLRLEYSKHQIQKFTMDFSKNLAKEENNDRNFLQKELKTLEKNPN